MDIPIEVVHASGRFDRSQYVAGDNAIFRKISSIITSTETKRIDTLAEREAAFGGPHWDNYKGLTVETNECDVQWDNGIWEPCAPGYTFVLSNLVYRHSKAYGGKMFPRFRATVQPLRHKASGRILYVVAVHMPLRNTRLRRLVWVAVAKGLASLINGLKAHGHIAVMFDTNAGWKTPDGRALLQKYLSVPTGLHFAWEHNVPLSVHSLIDNILTDLTVREAGLLAPSHSDHQPIYARLLLPGSESPVVNPGARPSHPLLPRPVPHPWVRRTARWKRNHPVLWHKILAWRAEQKALRNSK